MRKEEQTTMAYEAPQVEVIEVEVEQGFASSGDAETTPLGYENW